MTKTPRRNFKELYQNTISERESAISRKKSNENVASESVDGNEGVAPNHPKMDESIISNMPGIMHLSPDVQKENNKPKFTQMHADEEYRERIRQEATQELREQIRQEVTAELTESIRDDLYEVLSRDIKDQLLEQFLRETTQNIKESHELLLIGIQNLNAKVAKLNESLKIEIPTPVVQVTTPKMSKKIIRDENGCIDRIIDVEDD